MCNAGDIIKYINIMKNRAIRTTRLARSRSPIIEMAKRAKLTTENVLETLDDSLDLSDCEDWEGLDGIREPITAGSDQGDYYLRVLMFDISAD